MKAVVLYRSKTGFTRKYAEWIAKELSADIFDASRVSVNMLADYDTVIYGGRLHAVGIDGVKLITQNLDKLNGKRIVVFATGASPSREEAISEVINHNFTPEQQKRIKFFYMRGGFDYSRLPLFDKALMQLLKWKIQNKKKKGLELNADETGMLAIYDRPVDYTRKDNIDEILSYVNAG